MIHINPSDYLENACNVLDVDLDALRGDRRSNRVRRLRRVIGYCLRTDLKLSLPEIGDLFHRDHSTVHKWLQNYNPIADAHAIYLVTGHKLRVRVHQDVRHTHRTSNRFK